MLVKVLNTIIAIYFFLLANLFFWGNTLGVLLKIFEKEEELVAYEFWSFIINIILALFLIYGSIIFFRRTEQKYSYGLTLLAIVLIETQLYRLFFVTQGKLEITDIGNLLFFGIPFGLILIAKNLNHQGRQIAE